MNRDISCILLPFYQHIGVFFVHCKISLLDAIMHHYLQVKLWILTGYRLMLSDLIHEVEAGILVHCSLETRTLFVSITDNRWAWFSTLQFSLVF
jgi:hypothetical protein